MQKEREIGSSTMYSVNVSTWLLFIFTVTLYKKKHIISYTINNEDIYLGKIRYQDKSQVWQLRLEAFIHQFIQLQIHDCGTMVNKTKDVAASKFLVIWNNDIDDCKIFNIH